MSRLDASVLIKGYYIPDNIGDDVLMIVTSKIVAGCIPPDSVVVGVARPDITSSWLPEIRHVRLSDYREVNVETCIYGGGGQFFSFPMTNQPDRFTMARDQLSRLLKRQIGLQQIRQRFSKPSGQTTTNIQLNVQRYGAFCVGVGPFVPGSNEIELARMNLEKCEFLSVRDSMSKKICDKWGLSYARVRTDATFFQELWLNSSRFRESRPRRDSVAFIFRAWPHSKEGFKYFKPMRKAAKRLRREGLNITFVSFAKMADSSALDYFSDEDLLIWEPAKGTPATFIRRLAESFDLVVSARAHGIILPAIAGLPGICIGIEPKLYNVHAMLPNGTQLWGPPFDQEVLVQQVLNMLENLSTYYNDLKSDVHANHVIALEARKDIEAFLHKESNS